MEYVAITYFFNFYTKLAESSFLCRFHVISVFVLPQFDLCTSDIFFINKQFRTCANAFGWDHCQVVWILRRSTLNSFLDGRKSNSDVFPSF